MPTLALGGWRARGTVAVADGGRLLAALDAGSVAGLRGVGLLGLADLRPLVARALAAAGVDAAHLSATRLVADSLAVNGVSQAAADAQRAALDRGLDQDAPLVFHADEAVHAFAAHARAGRPVIYAGQADAWTASAPAAVGEGPAVPARSLRHERIVGYGDLVALTRRLAAGLGVRPHEAWSGLQALAASASPAPEWAAALRTAARVSTSAIHVSPPTLDAVLSRGNASISVPLDAAPATHVGAQHLRSALASAWLARVGEILAEFAPEDAVFAGEVGVLPSVVGRRISPVLPCPDARAAVIGAALMGADVEESPALWHVGEAFDETAVKMALEAARLDYLYEPRPERLMDRISTLLASGHLVGWFEGRSDIGDVPSGARVVLADAAERYSRDNINVYLRQRSLDHPLTVVMADDAAARVFGPQVPPLGQRARVAVPAGETARFEGAASRQGMVDLVAIGHDQTPGLARLLAHHEARTGHPALIATQLSGADGPVAARPSDAIGVAYTTPVDALVMGRFVVFKDYWLLRTGLTPS